MERSAFNIKLFINEQSFVVAYFAEKIIYYPPTHIGDFILKNQIIGDV